MNTTPKSKKRVLSVFTLVMINVIAIDSLRNLPANAEAGLSIIVFYIIAGILFLLPCVLITAELATHHPKTGGSYVWVREAFGAKWGFFNIWLQWIYNVFWYPTILSFIAVNIAYLINPQLAQMKAFMLPMIIIIFLIGTLINSYGMKLSGIVSSISAIVGTIIPMLLVIGLGITWILDGKPLAISLTANNLIPHLSHINDTAFLVVVFFSLMGLEMSAVHAEEVNNPRKNYPKALLYSSIIILLTLIFASAAISIVVPKSSLNIVSGLDQAFALFLGSLHMKWLMPIVILIIILGGFGGMAAWIIGPTKGLMIAADDDCLPPLLRYRNSAGVPIAVLFMQAIFVIILAALFLAFKYISTWYWILSDLTAQLALVFYIVLFAAAIKLRYKTRKHPQAYRIPGGKVGIWIVGGVGIFGCLLAIALGFLPPDSIKIYSIPLYETILLSGIVLLCLIPFVIYRIQKGKE